MRETHIVLQYSSRHFSPQAVTGKEYTSAGQIAKMLYEELSMIGSVRYGDTVSAESSVDLIMSPYMHKCLHVPAALRIAFPANAHPAYTNREIMRAAHYYLEPAPLYYFREADIAEFHRGFLASDRVIVIGNETIGATFVEYNVPAQKIKVIPCGVDYLHFQVKSRPTAVTSGVPVFLHNATQISVRKGIHYIADAWPQVLAQNPDSQLIIIGGEGTERSWRSRIDQKNITYRGPYVNGSAEYQLLLSGCHYVVFPSLSEGQPGTVLEAMAMGCVPITFASSGIDALDYGGWEALHASSESLANCMIQAAGAINEWPERSRCARRMVESRHSWALFRSAIRTMITSLIAEKNLPISL